LEHYLNQLVILAFVLLGTVSGGTNAKARQGLVELSQAIDGIEGMRLAVLITLLRAMYF
jgi:DCN1-like protein 1/2